MGVICRAFLIEGSPIVVFVFFNYDNEFFVRPLIFDNEIMVIDLIKSNLL